MTDVPSNSSTSNNPFAALAVSVTGQADATPASVNVAAFAKLTLKQLQEAATTLRLSGFSKLKKDALVEAIWSAWQQQAGAPADGANGHGARAVESGASTIGEAVTPVAHKFELGRPAAGETKAEPSRDIPWGYGRDRITAMAVDPDRLFVYWEVLEESIAKAVSGLGKAGAGAWLNLRIYDTTGRIFDGTNAHSISDQGLDRGARQWFFTLGRPTSEAIVELGMKAPDGGFQKIARSGRVQFPRRDPVEWSEPEWLTVRADSGKVERAWISSGGRAGAAPAVGHATNHLGGATPEGGQPGDGVSAAGVTSVAPWEAIIRTSLGESVEVVGVDGWTEVEVSTGFEAQRTLTWEEHGLVSSWQEGPFPYPVEVPDPVRETSLGRTRVFKQGTRTHVVYGPWQVTIRGLGATSKRAVISRWEVYRSWGAEESREILSVSNESGAEAASGGGSEGRFLGASERRWGSASEVRLGGSSEVFYVGASERRLGGSSERMYAGASERLLKGASERMLKGASERRLGGASEGRLGGSSGQGTHGAAPPPSAFPSVISPPTASKPEGSR